MGSLLPAAVWIYCIKIFLIFFSNSPFYFKSVSTFQIMISNFKIYNKNNLSLMGFQYLTHTNWLRIVLNFVKIWDSCQRWCHLLPKPKNLSYQEISPSSSILIFSLYISFGHRHGMCARSLESFYPVLQWLCHVHSNQSQCSIVSVYFPSLYLLRWLLKCVIHQFHEENPPIAPLMTCAMA